MYILANNNNFKNILFFLLLLLNLRRVITNIKVYVMPLFVISSNICAFYLLYGHKYFFMNYNKLLHNSLFIL